ncbi:transcriptional regulator [Trinickia terrae]|uniref:Transcriptional regulator n=1 Tax=Trinickia terrae TaxID=2571161 RepID=A0A4U1HS09_9BURK|nr:MliC family protein [Trinickia terrae]TKC83163.1 transcriptional regulator [Trinickia terrae]
MKSSILARCAAAAALFAGAAVSASAASLTFADIPAAKRQSSTYTCSGGKTLKVSYWNTANGQSFALVPVNGRLLLFVNTLAASGAKYQADRYTWWTKGPRADLYDAAAGENATPILAGCVTLR